MRAIQELGDSVARAWLAADYADEAFPEIASHALRESELLRGSESQLSEWFLTDTCLPDQQFREFGQPALTLYRGHKFYIELLYWLDSTTAIHQHSFAGAFGVFKGSSLHTQYDFHCDRVLSSELIVGDLIFRSSNLLTQGDVREIHPGKEFIHSLFHLERPSISLVVRTHSLTRAYPQYSYRRPGIGYDPFFKPEPFATRMRLLEALRDVSSNDFWNLTREMLLQSDPWMTYALLSMAYVPEQETTGWESLVEVARKRHGSLVNIFLHSLEEKIREQNITARRREIWDPDHRFFVALLLNLPHREAIYRLVSHKFPEADPETLILRWIHELAEAKKIGLDFDALSLAMLQHALNDLSLEDVYRGLAEVFGEAQVNEERSNLNRLWSEIHEASLLRPLLQRGASQTLINPVAHVSTQLRDDNVEFKVEAPIRGEGLRCTDVSLKSHPGAFSFLMRAVKDDQNGDVTLTSAETEELRSLGLLIRAEDVSRPVELDVTVITEELETDELWQGASSDIRCEADAGAFPAVSFRVLPQGEIVSLRDPVRRAWFPYSLSSSQVEILKSKLNGAGPIDTPLHTEWSNMLAEVSKQLVRRGFAIVPSLIPSHLLSAMGRYYRQRLAEGYIRLSDGKSNQYAAHREPLAEWIHQIVAEALAPAFSVPVKPSYSYLCVYKGGATLDRHTDRPQCEFTVSLCVDASTGGERWPLYVESPVDEALVEVHLRVGDAIIFKGRELPHFRRDLPSGESFTSILFHFVETSYEGGLD